MSGHSDDTKEMLTLLEQADEFLSRIGTKDAAVYIDDLPKLRVAIGIVLIANRWREP